MVDKQNNDLEDGTGYDRRQILRGIGGMAGAGMFGFQGSPINGHNQRNIERLKGRERKEVIEEFKQSSEYRKLINYAKNKGYFKGHGTIPNKGEVVRVESQNNSQGLVITYFELKNKGDEVYIVIGKNTESEGVEIATLEYDSKETMKISSLPISSDKIPKSKLDNKHKTTTEITLVDATDGMKERVISPWENQEQDDNDSSDFDSNTVTTSSAVGCFTCQAVVSTICYIGCTAPTMYLCGIITTAHPIGGAACASIVEVTCPLIALFGCGFSGLSEMACEEVGYC